MHLLTLGKSVCINELIRKCIEESLSVLMACPTGFLASKYKSQFSDSLDTDTVHAAFHISINHSKNINWNLSLYQVIFIDEVCDIKFKTCFISISQLLCPKFLTYVIGSSQYTNLQMITTLLNDTYSSFV